MNYYVLDEEEDHVKAGGKKHEVERPVMAKSMPEERPKASKAMPPPQSASVQQQSKHPQERHADAQRVMQPQSQSSKPRPKPQSHRKSRARAQSGHQQHPQSGAYHHMPAHASVHVPTQPPPPPISMPTPPVMETLTVKYQAGAKEMAKNLKDLSEALIPFSNSPVKSTGKTARIMSVH